VWCEGFNWDSLQRFIAASARQERDLWAFAKKAGYKIGGVWKETASGAKDDRAERKKVLALAQVRKIDVLANGASCSVAGLVSASRPTATLREC